MHAAATYSIPTYLVPHRIEAVVAHCLGTVLLAVLRQRSDDLQQQERVHNLSGLDALGLGQVTGGDGVDGDADRVVLGFFDRIVDHVSGLEYISAAPVLIELPEVDLVWLVACLVVQGHQLATRGPRRHGHIVGGVDTRPLRVDAAVQ